MSRAHEGLAVRDLALRAGARPGGRLLFESLSFTVERGERWIVLGPNGAGKSSLLAALAGILAPARGAVSLDGRALADWSGSALADRRAWCPQFWTDPFPATVRDTARLAHDRSGWWQARRDARDARVDGMLARLDLDSLSAADVRTLSGGERQRVALATTLLQEAPILLLDEPASHLDLAHQRLLHDLLVEHAAAGGSVVASLHDPNLAWDLASHVVLLDGRGGAEAGPRDALLTAERLGAVFAVPMRALDIGSQRRFWSGVEEPSPFGSVV